MNGRYRYRPGDWYAVLDGRAAVLLPPGETARAARCWQLLAEDPATDGVLDTLLDELSADGLSALPALVLLETGPAGGQVRVLVRGEPVVETGAESFDGTGVRTWLERTLPAGSAVAVRLPGAPGLGGGGGEARDETGAEGPDEPVDERPDGGPDPAGRHLELDAGLVRVSALLLGGGAVQDASTAPPGAEAAPAPAPEPVASEPGWAEEDHDGLTRSGLPDPGPLPGPPGIAGQPQPPGVLARPVARLVFSSGEVVDVDRAVVVGRAPEARRFRAGDQPRLVAVPSPQQEISSTHLEVRPGAGADHGSATVTDLGSTNGTVLLQPGLGPEELRAGVPVALLPGAVVDLGDSVTIQVTRP